MSLSLLLAIGALYVLALMGIAFLSSKLKTSWGQFTVANRSVPWLFISLSMIGTTISGVTYISVPGKASQTGFNYLFTVIGYWIGYQLIATILLPLYYRQQSVSIYAFLGRYYGGVGQKVGALFFLIARGLGAAARLYIAVSVLTALLPQVTFEGWLMSALVIIPLYTLKGGIRTLLYTDLLQTAIFLFALGYSLYTAWNNSIIEKFHLSHLLILEPTHPEFFVKEIVAGILIAFTMTGLDQDQMQKNLACRNLSDAQKNIRLYSTLLIPVNAAFLLLGLCISHYITLMQLSPPAKSDALYPSFILAHEDYWLKVFFVLGLWAATFSSVDGALTALTTSTLQDFFPQSTTSSRWRLWKNITFLGWVVFFALMGQILHKAPSHLPILDFILRSATYTYGPLISLFGYALLGWPAPKPLALPLSLLMSLGIIVLGQKYVGHTSNWDILFTGLVGIGCLRLAAAIFGQSTKNVLY
ncbi:MAG: sodium:solute symporter family transporter [Bacteroidia bacterium]